MSEIQIINDTIHQLTSEFTFERHIKGTHFSGKRLQIDFIIKPINNTFWKNKNICFGLEFKDLPNLDQKGDTTDFTKWLAQCIDYSNTYWDNYGYIYILTCPGISDSDFLNKSQSPGILAGVMSHLGIGELKHLRNYGWSITLHDSHRIWSQKKGVETAGKLWNLERTFGSR